MFAICARFACDESGRDERKSKNHGNPHRGIVGFSRLAAADEDRTLARLRPLRGDLIDPTAAVFSARAEAWRLAGVPEQ